MNNIDNTKKVREIPTIFDLNIEHYTVNELKKILGIIDIPYNKSILLKSMEKIKKNIIELEEVGENKKMEITNFIKKMGTILENDLNQIDRFGDLWKKINITNSKIIKNQDLILKQNETIIEFQKKILENIGNK
jgi:hypothetical protein